MMDIKDLQGLLSFDPTAQEKERALTQGLLMGGLGILGQNAQNPRGAGSMGSLSGAMPGLMAYNQMLDNAPKQRMQNIQGLLAIQKLKKDMEAQELLKQFVSGQQQQGFQTGQGALSAEQGVGGGAGPTNAAAARIPQSQGFQPPNFGMLIPGGVPAESVNTLMKSWELQHPKVNWQGGIPTHERTGLPMSGVPFLPQTNQQGFSTTPGFDPTKNQFSVGITPGAVDAFTTQQNVAQRANASFDLVDIPMPGGGTQKMPRAQAVDLLTQQITGKPPSPQPQQPTQQRPQLPPAHLLQNRPPAERDAITQAWGPYQRREPVDVRMPGFRPPEAQLAADKVLSEGRAKDSLEQSQKFRNAWTSAAEQRGQLDLLENLFADPNVASGALADNISSVKGVADSFNIKWQGKPAEDVIKAVAGEMALKFRTAGGENLMPGAITDYEQGLLRAMQPNLAQSREGRMLLTQVYKARADRMMKIGEIAAEYEDKNGKLDAGFQKQVREYVRANPMFDPKRIEAMVELSRRLGGGR